MSVVDNISSKAMYVVFYAIPRTRIYIAAYLGDTMLHILVRSSLVRDASSLRTDADFIEYVANRPRGAFATAKEMVRPDARVSSGCICATNHAIHATLRISACQL